MLMMIFPPALYIPLVEVQESHQEPCHLVLLECKFKIVTLFHPLLTFFKTMLDSNISYYY